VKKLPLLIVALVLIAGIVPVSGQGYVKVDNPWEFSAVLDTAAWPQFAAVDADGNIWIGDYSGPMDIYDASGNLVAVWDSVTYNDGTSDVTAAFRSCKGMAVALNGNILYLLGTALVELDQTALTATTDTVTTTAVHSFYTGGSTTGPSVDDLGYIYVGKVVGGGPVWLLDANLNEIQTIDLGADAPGYSRGLAVSGDGMTLISGNLSAVSQLKIWTSTDLITYTVTDSILEDANGDTIVWDQKVCPFFGPEGKLWVGIDDYAVDSDSLHNNMTVFDMANEEYFRIYPPDARVDTTANANWADTDYGKGFRGVAWSNDGSLAYIVGNDQGLIYVYENTDLKVDERTAGLPEAYQLAQNFPNPFNPTTTIAYEVTTTEHVKLVVYNIIGQKIRTLVNNVVTAGPHRVVWDGTMDNGVPVPSGMYVYRLETNMGSIAKTMVLIK
jgi:sugar lactone lactonase YvrE